MTGDRNSGARLLGKVLLESLDFFWRPIVNIRHRDPCVDVVRRGEDMAVADRRLVAMGMSRVN